MQKSSSPARHNDRPLLAPSWLIAVMVVLVAVALAFMYPKRDLISKVASATNDHASTVYLKNLLRAEPNNPDLRLLLAKQYLQQGDLVAARTAIEPSLAAADRQTRTDATGLMLELLYIEYRAIPESNGSARGRKRHEISSLLDELGAAASSPEQLIKIANLAFEAGLDAKGAALYAKVGSASGQADDLPSGWYAKVAKEAFARGQYRSASELYMLASKKSATRPLATRYKIDAIKALQSGNEVKSALALAIKVIPADETDEEVLYFVTALARAAGDPVTADKFVRRLLKISLMRQMERIEFAAAHGGLLPMKVSGDARHPGLSFDDRAYTMGFEVFLDNKNLDDAWKLASSAVQQSPDNLTWRERLAKVAEWSSHPESGLENWLVIAKATNRDDAWQAVLRLAPGLFNYNALFEAAKRELRRNPRDLKLMNSVIDYAELDAKPAAAIDVLQGVAKNNPSGAVLELIATLATRDGQNDLALETWGRIVANPEWMTANRVVRAAIQAFLQNKEELGRSWLIAATPHIVEKDESAAVYLRMLALVTERDQDYSGSVSALSILTNMSEAKKEDYARLVTLLSDSAPSEAAAISVKAWERFGLNESILTAVRIYSGMQNWSALSSLLKRIEESPAITSLRGNPEFVRLVGLYFQSVGNARLAKANYERALKLEPADSSTQQAYIWLLIDSNDTARLKQVLVEKESKWRRDPSMHDVLASAYQALSLPKVALDRYLTPQLKSRDGDLIWMMNYADALEQNQKFDSAWMLRKSLLKREARNPDDRREWLSKQDLDPVRRLARARLILTNRPGDPAYAALREFLRLDRDADNNLSAAAVDTAAGWLNDAGQQLATRGHLWKQFATSRAKKTNRALWAEISGALTLDDRARAGQLLEEVGDALPRYDRIDAAKLSKDTRRAQSDAFEASDTQDDDEPLHTRLSQTLRDYSNNAAAAFISRGLDSIDEVEARADVRLIISPDLSVTLSSGRITRAVRQEAIIGDLSPESFAGADVRWANTLGDTNLAIESRDGAVTYTPISFGHAGRIDDRLSYQLFGGINQPSNETIMMRVAGMRDDIGAAISYRATRKDVFGAEQRFAAYQLQDGISVGTGSSTTLVYSHMLHQGKDEIQVGGFWSAYRYSASGNVPIAGVSSVFPSLVRQSGEVEASTLLPKDFYYYGLRASANAVYETTYTRAIRPFATLALTQHSDQGLGYNVRVGVAGRVFGADHLSFVYTNGKSGLSSVSASEWNVRYRYFY